MNLQIIDLKDIAKAYIQKAVYKISGEGSDPSINIPRIQLKHGDQNKVRFGMLYYWGEGENAYVAKDGTNYTIGMGIPADSATDIPDGWTIISSQESGFAESSFPGAEYVGLTVYEVDLTVAKTFSVEIGANNFLRCYYVNEEKEIDGDVTFPSFFLPIDFVTDGDCGYVKEMEVADTLESMLDSDSLGLNLEMNNGELGTTTTIQKLGNVVTPQVSLTQAGGVNAVPENTFLQLHGASNSNAGLFSSNASTRAIASLFIAQNKGTNLAPTPAEMHTNDTASNFTGIHLYGRNNTISIGLHRAVGSTNDTTTPICVVDKYNAPQVYILGKDVEWKTITVDGTQMTVLAAKA